MLNSSHFIQMLLVYRNASRLALAMVMWIASVVRHSGPDSNISTTFGCIGLEMWFANICDHQMFPLYSHQVDAVVLNICWMNYEMWSTGDACCNKLSDALTFNLLK